MAEFKKFLRNFVKEMLECDPFLLVHSLGVTNIAWQMAVYLDLIPELQLLICGSLLHDIGKSKLNKLILQKKGPLNDKERLQIQCHPAEGVRMLSVAGIGREIRDIVLYHHERWDGNGYFGLRGEKIPLTVQIVSLADAMDAMLSNRSYRQALPPLAVYHEVERCAGSQFSPELIAGLQKSGFWPQGHNEESKAFFLLERERQWLRYLKEMFNLRHPLVLIQSKRIDKLLATCYEANQLAVERG